LYIGNMLAKDWEPDRYYHIYNHANGNENLFVEGDNYKWFLRQYHTYISPIADTYAYCLMPNHFHFLIKLKSSKELLQSFPKFETLERWKNPLCRAGNLLTCSVVIPRVLIKNTKERALCF
jgi:hypothetical protein